MKEIYHVKYKGFDCYGGSDNYIAGSFSDRKKAEEYARQYAEDDDKDFEEHENYKVDGCKIMSKCWDSATGVITASILICKAPLNPVYGKENNHE